MEGRLHRQQQSHDDRHRDGETALTPCHQRPQQWREYRRCLGRRADVCAVRAHVGRHCQRCNPDERDRQHPRRPILRALRRHVPAQRQQREGSDPSEQTFIGRALRVLALEAEQ